MRLLLLTNSLHGGGAERNFTKWAEELTRRSHTVTMLIFGDADVIDAARTSSSPAILNVSGRSGLAGSLPLVARVRKQSKSADVLICNGTFANLVGVLAVGAQRTCKVIITEQNLPTLLLPSEGVTGRLQRRLARRLYRRADAVVAVSHGVAGDLLGGYRVPSRRLFVVPNPVLAGENAPLETPTSCTLIFAGRFVEQKDPGLFLRTADYLHRAGVKVNAVLYGDGPLEAQQRATAAELGVPVEFHGWDEAWLEAAKTLSTPVLVLTSAFEGFGNVLVEARRVGIPVVAASRAVGTADAVVDGELGALVNGANPQDFAEGVYRALSSAHATNAFGRFTIQRSVDELEVVLRSLDALA